MDRKIQQYGFCLLMGLAFGCNQPEAKQSTSESTAVTQTDSAREATAGSTQTTTRKTILFFGNSLSAGYGLEPAQAFPALIGEKIDSLNLPYRVVNAGLSGETTAGGKNRIDWLLRQQIDVFVLELGGNDGLRGIPVQETRKNLQEIIDRVKAKYPDVKIVLAGMQIPPNLGTQYTAEFRQVFVDLAQKNQVAFIPFLLEGVGGDPKLNQPDGIHPTAEGHKIVANNVWKVLENLLEKES